MRASLIHCSVLIAGLFIGSGVKAEVPTSPSSTQDIDVRLHQLQQKVDRLEAEQAAEHRSNARPVPEAGHDLGVDLSGRPLQTTKNQSAHAATQSAGISVDAPIAGPPVGQSAPGLSHIFASPVTAAWDGSHLLFSAFDGNFTFHPGVTLDFRDLLNYRQQINGRSNGGETAATWYDTQNGFDVSRARFVLDGTLFHQVGYYLQASADQGSGFTLLDAYASYRFSDTPFSVRVGQFKDPVWHERNISEANLLAVDRSLQEYFLAGGQGSRVQGFSLNYEHDRVRGQLVAHDGFNSQSTKFFDAGGNGAGIGGESGVTPTDFGFSGRAEYMLIGDRTKTQNPFTEYDQFSSLNAKQNILALGAGADYSQAGSNDLIAHSIDLQFNSPCGFSAYAAYVGTYRSVLTNQGVPHGHYYDSSFLVQAAYLIDNRFEPFVRYDWIRLDPASTVGVTGVTGLRSHLIQELTVGGNYYLFGQTVKLTVDGSWLPNGSPGDADALGVLRDSGKYEFVLRTQLQLSI